MIWDKKRIEQELQKLHRAGKDISYNALAKRRQSLVSAAAYHFGSYRRAVEQAGIDYQIVSRRPRWSRQLIIQLIKQGKRRGEDLHWSAVIQRGDELGRAAFASLQPRLFGQWGRALHAAGLDADEVSRYRRWNRSSVTFELRAMAQNKEPLNSGALQKEDAGLHAAALRYFGSHDQALRAARVDPTKVRRRLAWDRKRIIAELKAFRRAGNRVSDSAVRGANPALYGAAVRLFGSFTAARAAAGIKFKRGAAK